MDAGASVRRASTSATLAVAATDRGRRAAELAAGIGRREARYATQPDAPAPLTCRPRVSIPVEWPLADPSCPTIMDAAALRAPRIPIRTPAARRRATGGWHWAKLMEGGLA